MAEVLKSHHQYMILCTGVISTSDTEPDTENCIEGHIMESIFRIYFTVSLIASLLALSCA